MEVGGSDGQIMGKKIEHVQLFIMAKSIHPFAVPTLSLSGLLGKSIGDHWTRQRVQAGFPVHYGATQRHECLVEACKLNTEKALNGIQTRIFLL